MWSERSSFKLIVKVVHCILKYLVFKPFSFKNFQNSVKGLWEQLFPYAEKTEIHREAVKFPKPLLGCQWQNGEYKTILY